MAASGLRIRWTLKAIMESKRASGVGLAVKWSWIVTLLSTLPGGGALNRRATVGFSAGARGSGRSGEGTKGLLVQMWRLLQHHGRPVSETTERTKDGLSGVERKG